MRIATAILVIIVFFFGTLFLLKCQAEEPEYVDGDIYIDGTIKEDVIGITIDMTGFSSSTCPECGASYCGVSDEDFDFHSTIQTCSHCKELRNKTVYLIPDNPS